MPNGFDGSNKKWEEMEKPFLEIDHTLENFAGEHGIAITKNYHNWPERSLRWKSNGLDMLMQIHLGEKDDLFSFWVSVSKDETEKRYWKQKYLKEEVRWNEIKNNLEQLLNDGFKLAESWKRQDLEYAGDLGGQTFWQAIRNLFRSQKK